MRTWSWSAAWGRGWRLALGCLLPLALAFAALVVVAWWLGQPDSMRWLASVGSLAHQSQGWAWPIAFFGLAFMVRANLRRAIDLVADKFEEIEGKWGDKSVAVRAGRKADKLEAGLPDPEELANQVRELGAARIHGTNDED
ncbi:MAG TPA: hypothetical protein VNF75_09220 [Candidatus Dormibacteraeota bacterium]|nr:hypothetical protein [Candidatus Dormibacteraeota bacterium]